MSCFVFFVIIKSNIILRKDSDLYVYEVCRSLEDCTAIYDKTNRFKVNDKVNYYDKIRNNWLVGTVKSIAWKSYDEGVKLMNEVAIENGKTIFAENNDLKSFSSKINEANEVINLPMYNRYIKPDGTKTYMEFPKVISFGTWCTCRQIISEVILQAKHFMACYTLSKQSLKRQVESTSIKKGSLLQVNDDPHVGLPFKITLMDTSTDQCAICSSKQIEGNIESKKCTGCSIPDDNVSIRDIIKYFGGLAIHLDWNDTKEYGIRDETEDVSIKTLGNKIKAIPTLDDCLELFFKPVS